MFNRESFNKLAEGAGKLWGQTKQRASELGESASKKSAELREQAGVKAAEWRKYAGEVTESAKAQGAKAAAQTFSNLPKSLADAFRDLSESGSIHGAEAIDKWYKNNGHFKFEAGSVLSTSNSNLALAHPEAHNLEVIGFDHDDEHGDLYVLKDTNGDEFKFAKEKIEFDFALNDDEKLKAEYKNFKPVR